MKLVRLKITDPNGFRSLQPGFEYHFRKEWDLEEEHKFAPFICAGPNGSGKSNILEALAAIFYHMECMYLDDPPRSFIYDEEDNPNGFRAEVAIPDSFEVEYLIKPKDALKTKGYNGLAHIKIVKYIGVKPQWYLLNPDIEAEQELTIGRSIGRQLLPDYLVGYSSGENEILSLPFFKMRFIQFDEYWQALKRQLPYPQQPDSRLIYLDSGFSQAILICNLLYQNEKDLISFQQEVGLSDLKEFRIIIRKTIEISKGMSEQFKSGFGQGFGKSFGGSNNPAFYEDTEEQKYYLNISKLLEGDETASPRIDLAINRLKHCATCWFEEDTTNTLYLDYFVDDATKKAFAKNFDFELNKSPLSLFHAFQVLLTLNLFSVSDSLKADLYNSDSEYVSETVPVLASDERIMRFKFVRFEKEGVDGHVMLKNLSDGEHQLLHSLGLCFLFKNTQSLILLDEPETHFNPAWRANFISLLNNSLAGSIKIPEMLITTHSPFLISDSTPEKVLEFEKDPESNAVKVSNPEYQTLGASINKITMLSFEKRETIGGRAMMLIEDFRERAKLHSEDKDALIQEINDTLGDSVEKVLLIKSILDGAEEKT